MDDDLAILNDNFSGPADLNYDPRIPIVHAMLVSEQTLHEVMKVILPHIHIVVRDDNHREPVPGTADDADTGCRLQDASTEVTTNVTSPTTRFSSSQSTGFEIADICTDEPEDGATNG